MTTEPRKLRKEAKSLRSLAWMLFFCLTIPSSLGGLILMLVGGMGLLGLDEHSGDPYWQKEYRIMFGFAVFGLVAGAVTLWIGVKCLHRAARLETTATELEEPDSMHAP